MAKEDEDNYEEEADVADWQGMEKRIQNLEDAVASLKEEKVGGDDEVEEMSEETVEPRSTSPKTITTKEVVEFSAEDELANLKAENLDGYLSPDPFNQRAVYDGIGFIYKLTKEIDLQFNAITISFKKAD